MQDVLRFITCGSVDDGKSTLIGRLLWESKQVFEDHLSALERDSTRYGTQGDAIDFALLVDGLQSEREQSITIDVAYRFFATPRRRFIVADTPGHEQYTRNMATGASTSELAVLVVNAGKGLMVQTHRHARIVSLLGIRHLVMAINKMDLVEWDEEVFEKIVEEFRPIVHDLGFQSFQPIPVSALNGDNITEASAAAPWYKGPSLLQYLEEVDAKTDVPDLKFRMAVQLVNRPTHDFRGYCGRIASGEAKVGDRVRVVPGGQETKIRSIVTWQSERKSAKAGESITLCLADEVDVSRGSVLAAAADPADLSDQFEARVICLSDHHLVAGRSYLMNLHTSQAIATITAIKHQVDVRTGSHMAAKALEMNDIGVVNLSTDRPVPFEPYDRCRRLGSFILVDRITNETVGAGMVDFSLRRAANIHWQHVDIDKHARARQKLQKPMCLWFTGLSASGKSTIANLLERRLFAEGKHTYMLDGDNVRHGLNRDLGFTEADRAENIRRVTEVAKLLVDAGLLTLVSFISPYRSERELARSRFEAGEFIEVFVDTPLELCEQRDPKGLYAKARRGELKNFTGIDSDYEPPVSPEIHLHTETESVEQCVERILQMLEERARAKEKKQ
ncbi:MAG: sulfate adenylyltransferase subunit CysN [Acidobacteriaceae bacterium]